MQMSEADERALPISSSTPPVFAPEQRDMFVEVLSLFIAQRIPFAVSGAFALHQHTGIWRDTKDLDLFLTHDGRAARTAVLASAGFETEICDPVWLCKAHRGDYYVDLITGMSNAVITVRARLDRPCQQRRSAGHSGEGSGGRGTDRIQAFRHSPRAL